MRATLMISENTGLAARSSLERMTGIEPALSAWEADVLPLNYIRRAACCPLQTVGIPAFLGTSYRNQGHGGRASPPQVRVVLRTGSGVERNTLRARTSLASASKCAASGAIPPAGMLAESPPGSPLPHLNNERLPGLRTERHNWDIWLCRVPDVNTLGRRENFD